MDVRVKEAGEDVEAARVVELLPVQVGPEGVSLPSRIFPPCCAR